MTDILLVDGPAEHLLAVARSACSYIRELKVQLREKDERIQVLEALLVTAAK